MGKSTISDIYFRKIEIFLFAIIGLREGDAFGCFLLAITPFVVLGNTIQNMESNSFEQRFVSVSCDGISSNTALSPL